MNVVILAGGKGQRMRPYTTVLPKPLLPLGDKPILEHLLNRLKDNGFKRVYLAVGHLSSLIFAYFGNGQNFGIDIEYIHENEPLGTAGPLALLPRMRDPFLVLNGDLVTNMNFRDIVNYHKSKEATLTIGVHKVEYKLPLGFLKIDQGSNIIDYIEKPTKSYEMSMGVYVCDPKVLEYVNENDYLDFPDLTKNLIKNDEKVIGYSNGAQWIDVGRPEEYEKALQMFENRAS